LLLTIGRNLRVCVWVVATQRWLIWWLRHFDILKHVSISFAKLLGILTAIAGGKEREVGLRRKFYDISAAKGASVAHVMARRPGGT
jgi:hypothetical protein